MRRRGKTGRGEVAEKREPPSLYCHAGKHWVETMERDPFFLTADDVAAGKKPGVWRCPFHRGEVTEPPTPSAVVQRREIRRADRDLTHQVKEQQREAARGPRRRVVRILREGSKTTAYGVLECGHEMAVPKPKSAAELGWYRCRPCLKAQKTEGAE